MFEGPLAHRIRRPLPFEVRMACRPGEDADVYGPTLSKHETLSEARAWRRSYYEDCRAQGVTPAALVVLEVRHNCVVRYVGNRAIAIYREGRRCRTEDLRREMRFTVESVLGTTTLRFGEAHVLKLESCSTLE